MPFIDALAGATEGAAGTDKLKKLIGKVKNKKTGGSTADPGVGSNNGSSSGEYPEFKHGGKVKRTGLAKVHKGERVLTAKQSKRMKNKRVSEKIGLLRREGKNSKQASGEAYGMERAGRLGRHGKYRRAKKARKA